MFTDMQSGIREGNLHCPSVSLPLNELWTKTDF